jgi:hypothetical protein
VACIPYFLEPVGSGWKLVARGFMWHFESREKAIAFALATARDFAEATGQATSVRVQAEDGGVRQLRDFSGQPHALDPLLEMFRTAWGGTAGNGGGSTR